MDEKKKGPGDGESRGPRAQDKGITQKHNNDAPRSSSATPLFVGNVEPILRVGLTLIPLHRWNAVDKKGRNRGKTPMDGAWQTKEYDSARVLASAIRCGNNIGVRIPADWMVLDVDPRNFSDGRDVLAEFTRDFALDLSPCPHTKTGSGGHHYWFRKPIDCSTLDSLDGYPGIEFKSVGRQVVAPGSVHPNGKRYDWDDFAPDLSEAPTVPANLLQAIRRPERKGSNGEAGELTPERLARTLEPLDPCEFADHGKWLELMMACHHATNGEGRQEFIDWSTSDPNYANDAWIIGRRWDSLHSDRGESIVTIATLVKVLSERGLSLAQPDPDDAAAAAAEDFDDGYVDDAPAKSGKRWRFLTMEELEALPPPKWLVAGVLTEGSLAAIYGAPESCKSFLAVDLSMSVAGGIDWHGRDVLAGGVLYVAAEGAPGIGKRVRAWKVNRRVAGRAFDLHLMRDEINLAAERDADVLAFVRTVVDELGPLRLIIIDTLNQTAAGADENSAKDMGRYIASMKRLRDDTGATVVVIHHSGKDLAKGMRGSTALLGAMDTTLEVERSTDGRSIVVSVRKQKDAERDPPMRFNLEKVAESLVLRRTVMADAAGDFTASSDPIIEMALELAERNGGQVALKELVEALCQRDCVADKTARRRIEKKIPNERRDDCPVWMEPVDSRNPKVGILVKVASRG